MAAQASQITILSYNVWNFNDGPSWPQRSELIAGEINATHPDVVILLEMRKSRSINAFADMMRLLPQYAGAWHATMNYTALYTEPTSEGVAVLWQPGRLVGNITTQNIPFPSFCGPPPGLAGCDNNQRAVTRAVVRIGPAPDPNGTAAVYLNLFAIHLSTNSRDQLDNADFISRWLTNLSTSARPRVLMGDFNAHHPGNGLASRFRGFVNATQNLNCTYRCRPGPHHSADPSVRDGLLIPNDSVDFNYSAACRLIGALWNESDHYGLICAVDVTRRVTAVATPSPSAVPSPSDSTPPPFRSPSTAPTVQLSPTPTRVHVALSPTHQPTASTDGSTVGGANRGPTAPAVVVAVAAVAVIGTMVGLAFLIWHRRQTKGRARYADLGMRLVHSDEVMMSASMPDVQGGSNEIADTPPTPLLHKIEA